MPKYYSMRFFSRVSSALKFQLFCLASIRIMLMLLLLIAQTISKTVTGLHRVFLVCLRDLREPFTIPHSTFALN